jgi:hypothetical protein
MMPPLARLYLKLSPKTRRALAGWMFDLSIYMLPVVPFFPKWILVVLILELSLYALTLTSADWLSTTDVRKEQDGA